MGGGNRIADPEVVLAERVRWIRELDRSVREAVVNTAQGPVLVWYWYRVGGVETASPTWATLLELWGFVRRRPVAELEALSVLCEPDRCDDAANVLSALAQAFNEPVAE